MVVAKQGDGIALYEASKTRWAGRIVDAQPQEGHRPNMLANGSF